MQKAMNRFWDWLFHPSIRWYRYPKGKAAWFRYPSPGSNINKQHVDDYKTPFQYSQLNIRYKRPIPATVNYPQQQYAADPSNQSVADKLRAYKLLPQGSYTQQQLQQAKQRFQQLYNVPVQKNVYVNTAGLELPQMNNRQSIRQFIQTQYKNKAYLERQVLNTVGNNRRFIQQPQRVSIQSLDMFTGPHFQQTRLEVDYKLDNYANENAQRGYIDVRRGQKSFWKALDNSNDPKNIQNVQRAVGDTQPNDFRLEETKIQFEKNQKGDVVDVHPKTKSI